MKNKSGSILGCGWLGLPLARNLVADGFKISGSKRSSANFETMRCEGINPFIIDLSEEKISGDFEQFLNESSFLVLDIPPKLGHVTSEETKSFVKKIQNCIRFLETSSVKHVVFISSTSVYSDSENYTDFTTEESVLNPDNETAKQLVLVENLLLFNIHFKTTIIRFGGLIGSDRNPIKYLAGRQNILNPEAPINLIHRDDCIAIIKRVIESSTTKNSVFNCVAPFHPSRKKYYQEQARKENLEIPEFDTSKKSMGKKISSQKLEASLGYTFLHSSL